MFGRWKSQILYAAVKLGVFDCITSDPKRMSDIAKQLNLDFELTYRLLRALGSLGFLKEERNHEFSINKQGELFQKNHPQTLRDIILLEEGPEHYAIWKHLTAMIKDGQQNAFLREYGCKAFEYAEKDSEYAEVFSQAMNSYSAAQTTWVLDALSEYDFSKIHHLCDIGGGYGHLLSNLLLKHHHMKGSVLELKSLIRNKELLWSTKMGLDDRCMYIEGDMFREIHPADAYIMKMILHDRNDEECIKILNNINRSCPSSDGRLFIAEHLITEPEKPHFSKLFDIHMMCWGTGRERTVEEYSSLLEKSGWKYIQTFYPKSGLIGVIEAAKAKE
ncbi:MAG: acetylserotonin O-methyltransferase [Thermoproteota archaeon]|nr:acetylserotonin O-methyltransferase [Thermoproteota archaeon]